jgi:putative exporter of polyketide antibiotics
MGIETLNAMNEGMQASLMIMIEVIMLISILFTVVGLAIYLAGVAWLCFDESGSLRGQLGLPRQRETSASKARSARRLPLTSSLK